ncbi:MAG: glycoside hydrolase family 5 protein [Oscillospiraceae bacterium]
MEQITTNGFIRVNGTRFVDSKGNDVKIKGIAFGNNIWENPAEPLYNTHHNEESYRDIGRLGFNAVRFYMNYALFEDDSAPYVYKQAGFGWLDDNIAWAKKYGVGLILNMHYPQGGYQSAGTGAALWTDSQNQKRLIALWKEIARRYADETVIIGYGLLNEPIAPANTDHALSDWIGLAQSIADAIREHDKNHILFVERLCGYIDDGKTVWAAPGMDGFALINDSNFACEFHNYDPNEYTHQGFAWCGREFDKMSYPFIKRDFVWDSPGKGEKADTRSSGWQLLHSAPVTIKDTDNDAIQAVFQASCLGGGNAYIGEMNVYRIDENGEYAECVFAQDFSSKPDYYYYSADGSGCAEYTAKTGYRSGGCIAITGAESDSNIALGMMNAALRSGETYIASARILCENLPDSAVVMPRLDLCKCQGVQILAKDRLKALYKPFLDFSEQNNIAIYCGEFGAGRHAFEEGRNAEQYVEDLLDIFKDAGIAFTYHTYHEENFGLYRNDSHTLPDDLNQPLAEVFKRALKY